MSLLKQAQVRITVNHHVSKKRMLVERKQEN